MCIECNGNYPNCPVCDETPEPTWIPCPECGGEKVSECCGVSMQEESMICPECKDHADFWFCEVCQNTGEVQQ